MGVGALVAAGCEPEGEPATAGDALAWGAAPSDTGPAGTPDTYPAPIDGAADTADPADPAGPADAADAADPADPADATDAADTISDDDAAPAAPDDGWLQYGRTRSNLFASSVALSPSPKIVWETPIGHMVAIAHLVSDGALVYVRAMDGAAALDVETGELLWFTAIPGSGKYESFVIHGDELITTASGDLHALDRHTGDPAWTTAGGTPGQSYFAPKLDGAVLYLGGAHLHAVDLATKSPLWSADHLAWAATPALDDGRAYAVGYDAGVTPQNRYAHPAALFAVDVATGAPVWTSSAPVPLARTAPALSGGSVLVAGPSVSAFDASTGQLLWETPIALEPTGTDFDSAVAVAGGRVFAIGDAVYSLDVEDGAVVWRHPGGNQRSTLAVAPGTLVVNDSADYSSGLPGDPPGRLVGLDPQGSDGTTAELWSVPIVRSDSSPIIVGDTILFAQQSGVVIGLR